MTSNNSNNNTVNFNEKFRQKQEEKNNQDNWSMDEVLDYGREQVNETLKDSSGFFVIALDEDQNPDVIWGGSIDPYNLMGVMEYAKHNVIDSLIHTSLEGLISEDELDDE